MILTSPKTNNNDKQVIFTSGKRNTYPKRKRFDWHHLHAYKCWPNQLATM